MLIFKDILAISVLGVFFYILFVVARRIKERQKNRAEAFLACSRALLSHSPKQIENILIIHGKLLDKHMKSALYNRKIDLELDIETQETIQEFRKKYDIKCN